MQDSSEIPQIERKLGLTTSRRRFLTRSALALAGTIVGSSAVAACGDETSSNVSPQVTRPVFTPPARTGIPATINLPSPGMLDQLPPQMVSLKDAIDHTTRGDIVGQQIKVAANNFVETNTKRSLQLDTRIGPLLKSLGILAERQSDAALGKGIDETIAETQPAKVDRVAGNITIGSHVLRVEAKVDPRVAALPLIKLDSGDGQRDKVIIIFPSLTSGLNVDQVVNAIITDPAINGRERINYALLAAAHTEHTLRLFWYLYKKLGSNSIIDLQKTNHKGLIDDLRKEYPLFESMSPDFPGTDTKDSWQKFLVSKLISALIDKKKTPSLILEESVIKTILALGIMGADLTNKLLDGNSKGKSFIPEEAILEAIFIRLKNLASIDDKKHVGMVVTNSGFLVTK